MAQTGQRKRLKNDPTSVGAIVAHPTRSRCLTLLADRVASPNEMAAELGEELGNVSYHVRLLLSAGAIELVDTKAVRGAVEHRYRAVVRPHFNGEEAPSIPVPVREAHAREMLSLTMANASTALEAGTLCDRPDYHLSRTPLRVDEEGFRDLSKAFDDLLERVFEIQAESAERLGGESSVGVPVMAFSGFFEMPSDRRP